MALSTLASINRKPHWVSGNILAANKGDQPGHEAIGGKPDQRHALMIVHAVARDYICTLLDGRPQKGDIRRGMLAVTVHGYQGIVAVSSP